jgi:hypothetical protein
MSVTAPYLIETGYCGISYTNRFLAMSANFAEKSSQSAKFSAGQDYGPICVVLCTNHSNMHWSCGYGSEIFDCILPSQFMSEMTIRQIGASFSLWVEKKCPKKRRGQLFTRKHVCSEQIPIEVKKK